MSNKTQLQTNNTALDGYIARINAAKEVAAGLPEAGGGGGVQTATLTAQSSNASIHCVTPSGFATISNNSQQVQIVVPSIVVVNSSGIIMCTVTSEVYETLVNNSSFKSFYITGDVTINAIVGSSGGAD